jgi:hypothetical protein
VESLALADGTVLIVLIWPAEVLDRAVYSWLRGVGLKSDRGDMRGVPRGDAEGLRGPMLMGGKDPVRVRGEPEGIDRGEARGEADLPKERGERGDP